MKVKKKSGRIELFNLGKLETSIARASDDAKEPFTRSDVKNISHAVMNALIELDREIVDSKEIFDIVFLELEKNRFYNLARTYREGISA